MTVLQEDYRVSLDAFEGPLDLLLYLIRRAEVEITDIPVAPICDQYLAFLREVDRIDVELAGDFLVMASTLIELKSRTLAPREDGDDRDGDGGSREDDDPRGDLVRQLLAYQRFRLAAERLEAAGEAFAARHPRAVPRAAVEAVRAAARAEVPEDDDAALELEDAHAMDLAETYERIMGAIDLSRVGDHVVEMDDTPIALHQADLLDRLNRAPAGRLTLQSTFDGQTPIRRIGLFLATLELTRQREVVVLQDDVDAAIEIVKRDPEADDDAAVAALDGAGDGDAAA